MTTLRTAALAAIALSLHSSSAASQELRIVAMDYAFRVPEKARPGVNRFVFVNQGKELHHMIVMRLPDSRAVSCSPRCSPSPRAIAGWRTSPSARQAPGEDWWASVLAASPSSSTSPPRDTLRGWSPRSSLAP